MLCERAERRDWCLLSCRLSLGPGGVGLKGAAEDTRALEASCLLNPVETLVRPSRGGRARLRLGIGA